MEQHPGEFKWLQERVAGSTSILEVGSRGGASLLGFAAVAAPGAKLRSIDLGHWVDQPQYVTANTLRDTIFTLRHSGFDAECWIGNSHNLSALAWAQAEGPHYDFVFLDGDHDDPGVTQDWDWYGGLGTIVGFHDINNTDHSVPELWARIKANAGFQYVTEEIICGANYGIGIVRRA
jgi:hypothetical protein